MTGTAGRCRMPTIGVPSLDADHRCLHRIIDLLIGVDDGREAETMIATVLAMVSEYAWFHFQREDRVVAFVGCPSASIRAAEHRAFARLLDALRELGGARDGVAAAGEVHAELRAWLRHHVLLFDIGLTPAVTDPAAAERVARTGAPACLLAPRPSTFRSRTGHAAAVVAAVGVA